MTPADMSLEAGRQLGLPMVTIFSVRKSGGRAIAHALDFDLVATGSTPTDALRKLRAAVKHHIEFGFKNDLSKNDIRLDAPKECWDRIKDAPLTVGEQIEIDNNQRIQTMTRTAIDDTEECLTTA
jgi:hypothetical protein